MTYVYEYVVGNDNVKVEYLVVFQTQSKWLRCGLMVNSIGLIG